MHKVITRAGESIDSTLKRLKVKLDIDYVLDTVRNKRYHETESQKAIRKDRALSKKIKHNR